MRTLRRRMLEDMQVRSLSPQTQATYVQQVSLFARHFNRSAELLGPEEIRSYQVYLTNERKLAQALSTLPYRRFVFSTESRFIGIGALRKSFQLQRNPRSCQLSPVRNKFCSFWVSVGVVRYCIRALGFWHSTKYDAFLSRRRLHPVGASWRSSAGLCCSLRLSAPARRSSTRS